MSRVIHNPHDKLTKKILSDIKIAQSFFSVHLPLSLKKAIDLETLQLSKGSFVDASLREHLTDILYQVQIEGRAGYLYLLVEAQHKVDTLMPFRILQYTVNIMRQHLEQCKKAGQREQLPVVYPLVYYTGVKPYHASCDIYDNFAQPEMAKRYFMKPFKLIDLQRVPDNTLARHKLVAALEMVQKHVHDRNMQAAFTTMLEKGVLLQVIEQGGNYFELLLKYSLNEGEFSAPEELLDTLINHFPQEEKKVMTAADYLRKQGKETGKLEIAKKLLASGELSADKIAKVTGLSASRVKGLNS